MLQSWSTIYIVEFLCFVDNSLDVLASHKGDLSDHVPKFILLWSEIEVSDVTCSLEAVGVGHCSAALLKCLEAIQELLI